MVPVCKVWTFIPFAGIYSGLPAFGFQGHNNYYVVIGVIAAASVFRHFFAAGGNSKNHCCQAYGQFVHPANIISSAGISIPVPGHTFPTKNLIAM